MPRRLLVLVGGLLVAIPLLAGLAWLGNELLRPLPPTPTVTPSPAPTPVGGANGLIAFTSRRDGNSEIYLMNADGSDQRNLTNDPAEDVAVTWSPDGRRLAFLRLSPGGSRLFLVSPDGSGLEPVVRSLGTGFVSWSPDGEKLIMDQFLRQGSNWQWQWVQVKADGSGSVTPLSEQLPPTCFTVRASPDGARFAALCQDGASTALWLMDSEGRQAEVIARQVAAFDWSPDGQRLAHLSGRHLELSMFNLATGETTRLRQIAAGPEPYGVSDLCWSPDGTRLAFSGGLFGSNDIYLLWADGSGLTRLTDNGINASPRWSPDGNWLVYASSTNAPMPTAGVITSTAMLSAIYVLNIEDAFRDRASLQPVQLTFTGQDYAPQWQP